MNEDIRTLLTSKSRAKVSPRNASLKSKQIESSSSARSETVSESSPSESDSKHSEGDNDQASTQLQQLQAELSKLPQIGKRLAVHLEQGVRGDLVRLCDEQEITPETLIEAAFAFLESKPELVAPIVADAKVRLRARKRAGLIRRTMAMVQKYGNQ